MEVKVNHWLSFFDERFLRNSVGRWLIAVGVLVLTMIAASIAKRMLVKQLRRWTDRTENNLDDIVVHVLSQTRIFFYLALGIFAASHVLTLGPKTHRAFNLGMKLTLLVQCALWVQAIITQSLHAWHLRRQAAAAGASTMAAAIRFLSQLAVWTVVLVMVLSNLGIEVGALITGLGVGGVAAALAVQNVLGDMFASLALYFDRPFDLGDFIAVDDMLGSVERIGLRSTQLRSLSGEQLIFPNSDLSSHRIRNYKRMKERRILFEIGVVYETPYDKVLRIPEIIRSAIEAEPKTRFDRAHFKAYGDFSLNFETVYFVLSPDYNEYMSIQQNINLAIFRAFEEQGIVFAYPTQTLYLQRGAPASVPAS